MSQKFTMDEALAFAWETIKKNYVFFLQIMPVFYIISSLPSIIGYFSDHRPGEPTIWYLQLLSFVCAVITIIMSIGLIKICLKFYDNQKPKFADLFNYGNLFFKYFFASLLYGLVILGGLILLIIPGIIWAIKYQFVTWRAVETGKISGCFKASADLTRGYKWRLFGIGIVFSLINLLGVMFFTVGTIFTGPLTMLAIAHIYRKLQA